MKILFLDTEPIKRGAQLFVFELTSFFEKMGVECRVVYLYELTNHSNQDLTISTTATVLNGNKRSFFEKLPGVDLLLVSKVLSELKEFTPDIIVCNGSRTLKYAAATRVLYFGKAKWIARWIDDAAFWNPGMLSRRLYQHLIMPQFDASIGVSQASLQGMIRHYTFKKPTRVIHRVFDPRKFEQAPSRAFARKSLGIPAGEEVLLFLGNLSKQKRPDRFIAIIHELRKHRPAVCGILVGDGPLRKSCEQQVKSLDKLADSAGSPKTGQTPLNQLNSKITFFGYQEDVSPYLAAADVLVLTSDTEGLPGVILEAAHFEVPTVASAVGGIRECLLDGETGLIVADPSVSNFTQALEKLLADPTLKNQLGKNAKRFVSTHFRMELVAQQYLDFFKEIVP